MTLDFRTTIAAAWQQVDGTKRTFWIAIALYLIVLVPLCTWNFLLNDNNFFLNVLSELILLLFNAGLFYLGIRCAQKLALDYRQIFYPLKPGIIVRLIVVSVVKYIITLLPILVFLLLIGLLLRLLPLHRETILAVSKPIGFGIAALSLIYLQLRMILTTAYILDRRADFWSAVTLSFAATRGQTFTLLVFYLFTISVLILSALPLGIGLIWSLPFACILYGTIYQALATPVLKPAPQQRVFDA